MSQTSNSNVATSEPTLPPATAASADPKLLRDETTNKHSISNTTITEGCLDLTLKFLSTSDNETLLCVFAILAVVTYIILGRIGLLIIGVVFGVILHASWEGPTLEQNEGRSRTSKKRRELALEVSKRLLDWPKRVDVTEVASEVGKCAILTTSEELSATDLEYASFQPATAAALKAITDAVIRDYVK